MSEQLLCRGWREMAFQWRQSCLRLEECEAAHIFRHGGRGHSLGHSSRSPGSLSSQWFEMYHFLCILQVTLSFWWKGQDWITGNQSPVCPYNIGNTSTILLHTLPLQSASTLVQRHSHPLAAQRRVPTIVWLVWGMLRHLSAGSLFETIISPPSNTHQMVSTFTLYLAGLEPLGPLI